MRSVRRIRRFAARFTSVLMALLLIPEAVLVNAQQAPAAPQQQSVPATPAKVKADSTPAQETTIASDDLPQAPEPQSPPAQQSEQQQQQPPALPQQPVGTAAAPAEKPAGVPGSRPSGAAIAPAKQRRVRAFVISIGIALAAGAAVGAVVGLSKASHSAP